MASFLATISSIQSLSKSNPVSLACVRVYGSFECSYLDCGEKGVLKEGNIVLLAGGFEF